MVVEFEGGPYDGGSIDLPDIGETPQGVARWTQLPNGRRGYLVIYGTCAVGIRVVQNVVRPGSN